MIFAMRFSGGQRVTEKAVELFDGDREAACDWLRQPQPVLGGGVPIELAQTRQGAEDVEALINRIEQGVFS